jgi:hypothetical protein
MSGNTSSVTQRGGYNREVEWYRTETARLMGERSNFAGLVAAIERGGSGGCSGTKGCGMIRIEPFENTGGQFFEKPHREMQRMRRCDHAWRDLGTRGQLILDGRYIFPLGILPPGIHGQLGDLSGVVWVLAILMDNEPESKRAGQKSQMERLVVGAEKIANGKAKKDSLEWAVKLAEVELRNAHALWVECRAHSEVMESVQ